MQQISQPTVVYRSDYTPPAYLVDTVDLRFDLAEQHVQVRSMLALRRNEAAKATDKQLELDGQELELIKIALDGQCLEVGRDYLIKAGKLWIFTVPDNFVLEVITKIYPAANTVLEGLYQSSGNFCTQCEAQGFRRITWYPDRPDVMARFSVKIVAEAARYPVLLSNGNLANKGESDDGRHWVRWEDPHPKPSYLFALVAGDLQCLQDSFVTSSGNEVDLRIYVEAHNLAKCGHAMDALKQALQWDERRYGLEYDLDTYMIVAVDDFNMGAMENKGLNVFNSKYVLADQATATDADFLAIQSVVAHEYFHNWSGNRVTCRDWFQLSLKEGLTVFRDQQFSAELNSAAVKRVDDVHFLRQHQFAEDAGPMAHPVRPDSYMEINNFYTLTVYEKGAEIIRMLHTMLGEKAYRAGIDLYFSQHDGQAVTCDDFIAAMEDASGADLEQFRLWYSQYGTPRLLVRSEYVSASAQLRLHVEQKAPINVEPAAFRPVPIPLTVALFNDNGDALPLVVEQSSLASQHHGDTTQCTLLVTRAQQTFEFSAVEARPTASLLRDFSAPVHLEHRWTDRELAFLMLHDDDPFSRCDATQTLLIRVLRSIVHARQTEQPIVISATLVDAVGGLIDADDADPALRARALQLPSIESVAGAEGIIDIDAIQAARRLLQSHLADQLNSYFARLYEQLSCPGSNFSLAPEAMARRALRNTALAYLMRGSVTDWREQAFNQYQAASNMTDRTAALSALLDVEAASADTALQQFYDTWEDDRLVIDKWFSLQARADSAQVFERVKRLSRHPAFDLYNPNRARALIGAFCAGNTAGFHAPGGAGYQFLSAHVITLDDINPQLAARLVSPLIQLRRYDDVRQANMRAALLQIRDKKNLSTDVFEMVNKALLER